MAIQHNNIDWASQKEDVKCHLQQTSQNATVQQVYLHSSLLIFQIAVIKGKSGVVMLTQWRTPKRVKVKSTTEYGSICISKKTDSTT